MGGEDFAFVAQAVPSTFFFLGQGGSNNTTDNETTPQKKQLRTNYGLHHPQFALDEDSMPHCVEFDRYHFGGKIYRSNGLVYFLKNIQVMAANMHTGRGCKKRCPFGACST